MTVLICVGVAGWLAALIVEGYGLGIAANTGIGLLGAGLAALGGTVVGPLPEGKAASVVVAMFGAMLVLLIFKLIRRLSTGSGRSSAVARDDVAAKIND